MSEIFLGRGTGRRAVQLGKLLGEGAAGKVHALPDLPGVAAKLYHGVAQAKWHEAKIDAMLANPPDLPPAEHHGVAYPQIAWPQAKIYDASGRFIGFAMPEIDFARSTSLVNLLQKSSRRVEKLSDYYGYRVLVARNLASVFAELHRAGHHMIDMKPANLRFYPDVSWMAVVDTDGFSIAGSAAGTRGRIAASQLSDEYIAPESWKRDPAELGVEQDLFALALIIFQLLDNGVHPFAGAAGGVGQATDLQTRILDGLYPYALRPKPDLLPSMASVHRMFRRGTRQMFDNAFVPGTPRPTAEQWRDHLDVLLGQLVPCAARPGEHAHFGAGCGFCAHEERLAAAQAAARSRPRVQPRPVARPPQVRQSLAVVPHGRPIRAFVAPRRLSARWTGVVAALCLGGAVFGALQLWQPIMPLVEGARAADVSDVAVALADVPTTDITPFDEPRDYLVVPARGTLSVPMRSGPGSDFDERKRLRLHDEVVGRGTRADANGLAWVHVTRASDGATGFVPLTALMHRPPAPATNASAECGDTGACAKWMTAGDRALDARHRKLLAEADGYDRAYLVEGRKLWEEQRRRCDHMREPQPCRRSVNARWMRELENWKDADPFGRSDGAPVLTSALSTR